MPVAPSFRVRAIRLQHPFLVDQMMQRGEDPLRMLLRLFAIHCCSLTCLWNSGFPPSCPISGSVHATPSFPRLGPAGHGSPASTVQWGRYDPRHRVPWDLFAGQRYHAGSAVRGSARSRCPAVRASDHAGCTPDRLSSTWTMSGLPGFLASYPVAMPPAGRPMAPRRWRRAVLPPHHNDEGGRNLEAH